MRERSGERGRIGGGVGRLGRGGAVGWVERRWW